MLTKKRFVCLVMVVASVVLLTCLLKHTWADRQQSRPEISFSNIKTDEFVSARPTEWTGLLNAVTSNNTTNDLTTIMISQTIINEMQDCSIEMGVSIVTLVENHSQMEAIATKAATFLSALYEVIPYHNEYLSHTKSPCWHSNLTTGKDMAQFITKNLGQYTNTIPKAKIPKLYKQIFEAPSSRSHSRLYCLPFFLIAGFPKSGTTSLHAALSNHPQIVPPAVKELHWWARVPLDKLDKKYLKIVVMQYLLNFLSAAESVSLSDDVITYDASQSTLVDSNFAASDQDYCAMAAVVHRVLPNLKLIFIMRDPVERIHSHFYYMHNVLGWPNEMKEDSQLYFDACVRAAIQDFTWCLKNHSLFECANKKSQRKKLTTWLGVGVYYIQILEWTQFWPKENFLFLKTEQLSREPITVMNNITQFLTLDSVTESESRKWLSRQSMLTVALQLCYHKPEKY